MRRALVAVTCACVVLLVLLGFCSARLTFSTHLPALLYVFSIHRDLVTTRDSDQNAKSNAAKSRL